MSSTIPSPIRTAIDAALTRAEERYGVRVLLAVDNRQPMVEIIRSVFPN